MKINLLAITFLILSGIISCSNDGKKAGVIETTTETDTTSETIHVPEPPFDPDPTDTIPGDRYGINCSSKQTADLVRLSLKTSSRTTLKRIL